MKSPAASLEDENFAFDEELPQIEGDLRIFCNCEHFIELYYTIYFYKGSVIAIQSLQYTGHTFI